MNWCSPFWTQIIRFSLINLTRKMLVTVSYPLLLPFPSPRFPLFPLPAFLSPSFSPPPLLPSLFYYFPIPPWGWRPRPWPKTHGPTIHGPTSPNPEIHGPHLVSALGRHGPTATLIFILCKLHKWASGNEQYWVHPIPKVLTNKIDTKHYFPLLPSE